MRVEGSDHLHKKESVTGAETGEMCVDPLFHSNWNQSSGSPEELWRTDLKKSLAKKVTHLLLSVGHKDQQFPNHAAQWFTANPQHTLCSSNRIFHL